jgi:hypothetical protein
MFNFKLDTKIDYYVVFITIIKIIFVITALGHVILSHTNSSLSKYDDSFIYWKKRTEFIFIISMSMLMIYYFHPFVKSEPMSSDTRFLFFLFGWVLLVTANWNIFFTESPWIQNIANAFK